MVDETRNKILGAALEEFAENGYKGSTIRSISIRAGFTEMTIFRKFENKKNLFRSILNHSNEKMIKEFPSIFIEKEFETPREFLETLIKNLIILGKNNLEFIKITINESNKIPGNFLEDFINNISVYVEKNIQNKKIDYKIFVFNILSFIYLLLIDYGHSFSDHRESIEKYVNNLMIGI